MENRITKLFSQKDAGVLSVYFTAGFPELQDTMTVLKALQDSGAEMVELGIPFSDSVADGPFIQGCNEIALRNGMTLSLLFEQIAKMRDEITIPVVLMGSLNPILKFGVDEFIAQCAKCGVDGTIIPDLPLEEYQTDYREKFEKNDLSNIFLISPKTPTERITKFDEAGSGFLYLLSTTATTGKKLSIDEVMTERFDFIQKLSLKNPTMVGFGIADKAGFEAATRYSNGAIIGTAYLKCLRGSETIKEDTQKFLSSIRAGA